MKPGWPFSVLVAPVYAVNAICVESRRRGKAIIGVSLLFVWIVLSSLGCARSGDRCRFDVPAGRADSTLMQFAKQANVEIIYDAEAVGKATTNAVLGEYSPSDALLRMIAGTGLVVERDENTGAFAVVNGAREAVGGDRSTSSGFDRAQPEKVSPSGEYARVEQ